MTGLDKLKRVSQLCKELQDENNEAIVESRIEGLAKELGVDPFQCAFIYWTLHARRDFMSLFGPDVKVRFKETK